MKKATTTNEKFIEIEGKIKLIHQKIHTIETNHLKHMHEDIDKIDAKFDKLTSWIIYGVGAVALLFLTQILYFLSK